MRCRLVVLLRLTVVVLLVFGAGGGHLHAWHAYAHVNYGSINSLGDYANVPDFFPLTKDFWPDLKDIHDSFCWGHKVRRRGQGGGLAPDLPEADYDRYEDPAVDMLYLINNSLMAPGSNMADTAKGFYVHNQADSVVHFNYFSGGRLLPDGGTWLEHKQKERWADAYMLWDVNSQGGTVPASVSLKGNYGILNLAMKVFRKNRQQLTVDPSGENPRDFKIHTPMEIHEMRLNEERSANDEFKELRSKVLAQGHAYVDSLVPYVGNDGFEERKWNEDDLRDRISAARGKSQDALSSLQAAVDALR